jgi:hypothetical protein
MTAQSLVDTAVPLENGDTIDGRHDDAHGETAAPNPTTGSASIKYKNGII